MPKNKHRFISYDNNNADKSTHFPMLHRNGSKDPVTHHWAATLTTTYNFRVYCTLSEFFLISVLKQLTQMHLKCLSESERTIFCFYN